MASLLVDDGETLGDDGAPAGITADEPGEDNSLDIEELVVDDLLGDTRSDVVNEVTVHSERPADDIDLLSAEEVVHHCSVSERVYY